MLFCSRFGMHLSLICNYIVALALPFFQNKPVNSDFKGAISYAVARHYDVNKLHIAGDEISKTSLTV